ncbi:hypothetical protein HOLDEFILI_02506 [Holdemania filiformis DSM 12042]|uniref:Uncharacterized protein n=1 Tax=Holdemania filiformis DSM 12042 TaxID=545696 RepID=B9Y9K0_9FIRM|nr:hypothetical protein HOLDEFILI_02506 [Holdemania filiformis DSM 12042]
MRSFHYRVFTLIFFDRPRNILIYFKSCFHGFSLGCKKNKKSRNQAADTNQKPWLWLFY